LTPETCQPVDDAWHDAGPADLALSRLECRIVAGHRILIVRDAAGSYFAVAPDCSHAALPLETGRVRGSSLLCPHHGARFDLRSGRALGPPAWTGIASWPVKLVEERLEVRLG
jgi:3-phenylpropionate/trans-cinnamate dioxygenase ferredoxin component